MRRLSLFLMVFTAVLMKAHPACAQNADQDLSQVNDMIATLREEQATNQRSLQMLRDGTIMMVPFAMETREGKLVTLPDFFYAPDKREQIFGSGKPGEHPNWIKSMEAQYVPIPRTQFVKFLTNMAIMAYLEIQPDKEVDIRKIAEGIQTNVARALRQSTTQRDRAITVLEKRQARVNDALLRLMKRRDALEAEIRSGKTRDTSAVTLGWGKTWKTDWGEMVLQVSGSHVTGTFTHKKGKIEGDLSPDGKRLTGRWTQEPTRTAPNDAGAFDFTLASDSRSFTGKWWYGFDTSTNADGGWSATAK